MATAPDSRVYVHGSTHAARAQQDYLFGEAAPEAQLARTSPGPWFDLRTDWWIVAGLAALAGGMLALIAVL